MVFNKIIVYFLQFQYCTISCLKKLYYICYVFSLVLNPNILLNYFVLASKTWMNKPHLQLLSQEWLEMKANSIQGIQEMKVLQCGWNGRG